MQVWLALCVSLLPAILSGQSLAIPNETLDAASAEKISEEKISDELKRALCENLPEADSGANTFTVSGETWNSLGGNFFKASPKFELTGLVYKYADFDSIKEYAPKLVFNFDDAFRPQIFSYGKDYASLAEAQGNASVGRRFLESIYSMNTLGYMNSGNYELFNLQYSATSPRGSKFKALPPEKEKSNQSTPRKKPEDAAPIVDGSPLPDFMIFLIFGFFAVLPFMIKGWIDKRRRRRKGRRRLRI